MQLQELEEFAGAHEEETPSLHRESGIGKTKEKSSNSSSRSQKDELKGHGRCGETTTESSS